MYSTSSDEREIRTLANKYNSKKSTKQTEDGLVESVIKKFDACWSYAQSNYHDTWERSWKLYNNKRVKRGYDGISDVFVPMTFSTIETMVSALAGGKPTFDFLPPQEKANQDTDILNALLDYYWDKDQWDIKVQSFIRSMLIYGTAVAYIQWDMDHPIFINVPLRDFFFDPNAINIENASKDFYCGRRYLTTKAELESFEVVDNDPESKTYGELVKKYKNLDQIVQNGGSGKSDETDKQKKDLFYGSTAPDPEHTQVEVIEYWTEDKVCSVANRSVLIEDAENPYLVQGRAMGNENAKGIIPFVIQRDYLDESLFLGKGEVDAIADLQEWLNDLTNQNNDAITFTLNPMWNINPDKQDMKEQIQSIPGAVFPLSPGDLMPIAMPQIPNDAFNERLNIKNEIRETTAVDQVAKGVSNDQQATATEINSQIANAGQRLSMKSTQLENEGFHRLARIIFEMVKLYVNEPMLVRVMGRDGVNWQEFYPDEFLGEYEPKVQLESTVNAQKRSDASMNKELFAAFLNDPLVNQKEIRKMVLRKAFELDADEVDALLAPNEEMGAPMGMEGMDGMGEMGDFVEDPMTGELMPSQPVEPSDEELMALEQGF